MFYAEFGLLAYSIVSSMDPLPEPIVPMPSTKCFMTYIAYKRSCAVECTVPVSYAAWLYLRGLTNIRPW
jgi:hypothetical protein